MKKMMQIIVVMVSICQSGICQGGPPGPESEDGDCLAYKEKLCNQTFDSCNSENEIQYFACLANKEVNYYKCLALPHQKTPDDLCFRMSKKGEYDCLQLHKSSAAKCKINVKKCLGAILKSTRER